MGDGASVWHPALPPLSLALSPRHAGEGGLLLCGERLTAPFVMGGAMVLAGVVMAERD